MDFLVIMSFLIILILILGPGIIIGFFIIRAICKYTAKVMAEEIAKKENEIWKIRADYIANKIAEELKK